LALDGEFLIDTSRVIGPAPGDQEYPAVSFDGTNFLVVWQDWRSDYRGIYGARVTLAGAVLDPVGISISTVVEDQSHPAISFDGTNYLVVWQDLRSGDYDIYGARVSPAGTVLDDFPVVTQEGNQSPSAVARGPGDQMFLVYQSWAGTVEGKTYNAQRIWGKFVVLTGIEEGEQLTANGSRLTATVVRGVLNMGQRLTANGTQPDIGLFDTNGRKVADLKPGPNDIRHLAPGVYFISSASGVGRQASANSSFSGRHRHVRAVGFWNGGHWGC